MPASAQAPGKTDARQFGEINAIQLVSAQSNQCAEVTGSVANGQAVGQQPCIGFRTPKQNWSLEESGSNIQILPFQGSNDLSNQCLEVAGGGAADGTAVRIANCSGQLFQQWSFEGVGNGFQIKAAHSGKCLDNGGSSNGSLQQVTCSGANSHVWRLTPPNASYRVFPQHTLADLKCMDVVGGNIQLGDCTPVAERLWFFTPSNDGLQIQNIQSLQCTEVVDFSTNDGANIQEAGCTGGTNQEWRMNPVPVGLGNGTPVPFQLVARHSNKCLDESTVVGTLGGNIHQWSCLGPTQQNQLWNILLWNSFPFAEDDAFTISQQPTSLDVLANDGDPDVSDVPFVLSVTQPANGQAQVNADGQAVTYTANPGFVGVDQFTYTAEDRSGGNPFPGSGTVTATVTVTVQAAAQAQLINAVASSPVDIVFSNPANQQLVQSLNFREATSLSLAIPAGNVTIEARPQGSATAFASTTITLEVGKSYFIVAGGTTSNGTVMVAEAMAQAPNNEIRASFVNGVSGSPGGGLNVNLLNTSNPPQIEQSLVENVAFGATPTPYVRLPERNQNIQVASGGNEIGVFRFLLNGRPGEAFVGVLSGQSADASLVLDLYRTTGGRLGDTVTANEAGAEVPSTFTLRGNYPNPFNPTTTLRFDLPQAAIVQVEVIDLLGRVVMTVPERPFESGADQSLDIEASSLPSGMYLYRVITEMGTQQLIRTGRMMLVK